MITNTNNLNSLKNINTSILKDNIKAINDFSATKNNGQFLSYTYTAKFIAMFFLLLLLSFACILIVMIGATSSNNIINNIIEFLVFIGAFIFPLLLKMYIIYEFVDITNIQTDQRSNIQSILNLHQNLANKMYENNTKILNKINNICNNDINETNALITQLFDSMNVLNGAIDDIKNIVLVVNEQEYELATIMIIILNIYLIIVFTNSNTQSFSYDILALMAMNNINALYDKLVILKSTFTQFNKLFNIIQQIRNQKRNYDELIISMINEMNDIIHKTQITTTSNIPIWINICNLVTSYQKLCQTTNVTLKLNVNNHINVINQLQQNITLLNGLYNNYYNSLNTIENYISIQTMQYKYDDIVNNQIQTDTIKPRFEKTSINSMELSLYNVKINVTISQIVNVANGIYPSITLTLYTSDNIELFKYNIIVNNINNPAIKIITNTMYNKAMIIASTFSQSLSYADTYANIQIVGSIFNLSVVENISLNTTPVFDIILTSKDSISIITVQSGIPIYIRQFTSNEIMNIYTMLSYQNKIDLINIVNNNIAFDNYTQINNVFYDTYAFFDAGEANYNINFDINRLIISILFDEKSNVRLVSKYMNDLNGVWKTSLLQKNEYDIIYNYINNKNITVSKNLKYINNTPINTTQIEDLQAMQIVNS